MGPNVCPVPAIQIKCARTMESVRAPVPAKAMDIVFASQVTMVADVNSVRRVISSIKPCTVSTKPYNVCHVIVHVRIRASHRARAGVMSARRAMPGRTTTGVWTSMSVLPIITTNVHRIPFASTPKALTSVIVSLST